MCTQLDYWSDKSDDEPFNKMSIFILELWVPLITASLWFSQMLHLMLQLPHLNITYICTLTQTTDSCKIIYVKKHHFKHTCNYDNDIECRKLQKPANHIFTDKFPISHYNNSRSWHCNDEIENIHSARNNNITVDTRCILFLQGEQKRHLIHSGET